MNPSGKIDLSKEEEAVRAIRQTIAFCEKEIAKEEINVKEATSFHCNALAAQEFLQTIAAAVQQKAHERISKVVSSCLSAVFDDPYTFKIYFEQKRGKTEARLRFLRRDLEVDPMTASGGGVIDVAAFALRAACLVLHCPRLRQVLILDEPFKNVSAKYQENIRQMLEELSADLKIQIIFVTHNEAYETGKIIKL